MNSEWHAIATRPSFVLFTFRRRSPNCVGWRCGHTLPDCEVIEIGNHHIVAGGEFSEHRGIANRAGALENTQAPRSSGLR
jgi:hypothetical protein